MWPKQRNQSKGLHALQGLITELKSGSLGVRNQSKWVTCIINNVINMIIGLWSACEHTHHWLHHCGISCPAFPAVSAPEWRDEWQVCLDSNWTIWFYHSDGSIVLLAVGTSCWNPLSVTRCDLTHTHLFQLQAQLHLWSHLQQAWGTVKTLTVVLRSPCGGRWTVGLLHTVTGMPETRTWDSLTSLWWTLLTEMPQKEACTWSLSLYPSGRRKDIRGSAIVSTR